ncbi:MAG: MMPL family transporter [Bacillota bacterium]
MAFPAGARWAVWLVSLGLLCGVAWMRLDLRNPVDSDILSMLPAEQDSGALAAASERTRDAFVNEVLILVSGEDAKAARAAAEAAQRAATAGGLETEDNGASLDRLLKVYHDHRYALLDGAGAKRYADQGPRALATDTAVSLGSPAGMANVFGSDPGGILTRFLAGLPQPYPGFLPDGPFFSAEKDGKHWFLLRTELGGGAFAMQGSSRAANAVAAARAAAGEACPRCDFAATGAPLFAEAGQREGKSESLWLSTTSTLLIMALIAWVFRSFAPHVLAGLQLVASVLAGTAAVVICFGSIQVLTLVFGTTLLGVAIDYAFLYFAEYWFGGGKPAGVMRAVKPGLTLGLATGVLAFAFLLLAGLPALTQFAVFSAAGLLEAGLLVALIFPVTLTRFTEVPVNAAVLWPQRFIQAACRPSRWRWLLPLAAVVLSVPGWLRLHASDDVRELQNFPPELINTDVHIREVLGQVPPPGFFLIEGRDLDEALGRETSLFSRLHAGVPAAAPLGLSRFLPPAADQEASLAAWQKTFADPASLARAYGQLGLPPKLAEHSAADWRAAPHAPMPADALFAAAPDLKRFVITAQDGVALIATLTAKSELDTAPLEEAAAAVPGTRFVAPLARIADTFHRVRIRATWLVILGYLLISALLLWRYGLREAWRLLYPPLLALGLTLGFLGWLGEPLNLFVLVALILILGLGRDYAVFLREGGAAQRSPALAVSLSAVCMLCSFGLLAFSRIPVLHVFGLASLVGILASFLGAPLSLAPSRRNAP